jgi:hypothetical protein
MSCALGRVRTVFVHIARTRCYGGKELFSMIMLHTDETWQSTGRIIRQTKKLTFGIHLRYVKRLTATAYLVCALLPFPSRGHRPEDRAGV